MLKTLEYSINLDTQRKILDLAYKKNVWVSYHEGNLNDDYMFINDGIRIGNHMKARKYIIMYSKHLNEWSDDLRLIMTDDGKLFEQWSNQFNQWEEEDLKERVMEEGVY